MRAITIFSVFMLLFGLSVFAQESKPAIALPDISFTGQAGVNLFAGPEDSREASFTFDGFEIMAQSYMHPDAQAVFVLGAHNHEGVIEFEVEEAFLTFSNLPFSTAVKAGRKLLDFGRINHIHPHEWLFLSKPLIYSGFLGGHGLNGDGASVEALLPLPVFLNVQAGIWRTPEAHHEEEGEEHHHDAFSPAGELYNLRLWSSFEPAEKTELEFGLSGLKGTGSCHEDHMDRIVMLGADLTLKMWLSAYSRFMVMAEAMYLERQVPPGTFGSIGAYLYAGLRLDKNWEAGLRYDWAETPGPARDKHSNISLIASNYITESFKIRAEYAYSPEEEAHTGMIKAVFGIGPHTHPLQ